MSRIALGSGLCLLAATIAFSANAQDQNTENTEKLTQVCAQNWPVVDENRDGRISPQEAEKATQVQFDRIDANDDGTISAQEWSACAEPQAADASDQQMQPTGDFAEFDLDTSGALSAQEAEQAAQADGADEKSTLLSSYGFAQLDTNNDGMVSAQEWNQRGEANKKDRFGMADKSGDQKVSETEFQEYLDERYSEAQKANKDEENPTVWVYYYYIL